MEASEDDEYEKQYTMPQFVEYMSCNLLILPSNPENHYVFSLQGIADRHPPPTSPAALPTHPIFGAERASVRERIKQGLQNLSWCLWDTVLIQFWEPKVFNGRRFLTTSWQPFALKTLYKGLVWYRKHCANHDVLVDEGAKEDELGPLGRVFLYGQPESSPDLRFYSIKEYPLLDHALRCGLRRYMALPVFDSLGHNCVGVLELVSFSTSLLLMYFGLSLDIDCVFKACDLRLLHMDGQSHAQTEGRKLALSEIKQMFKVVNETPNIPLALAWIPCGVCSGNCNLMEEALYTCDPDWNKQYELVNSDFLEATQFHKLQIGKGVAGRALSSIHKLCFCRSIYGFHITEYPLAHYARKAMLTVSFAICLRSAHTGSDPYVLEFFMRPGNRGDMDPRSLIHSLLVRMTRRLVSFRVASGQQLGEELLVEIVRFGMDDEPVYFQRSPSDRYPLGFEILALAESPQRSSSGRYKSELPMNSNTQVHEVTSTPQEAAEVTTAAAATAATATTTTSAASFERERKSTSLQITYEDLQSHFGKPKKEAADNLGVSMSTLKRVCRSHNISRWPYHIKNKANHSLFEIKSADKPARQADNVGSSRDNNSSGSHLSIATTTVLEDNSSSSSSLFTIKAQYKYKTVMFRLCIDNSSGMAKLEQELAKRVKLKIGSFEITYPDDDGSPIFLTCDDDLRFYAQNCMTLLGSTTIQLSVQDISS